MAVRLEGGREVSPTEFERLAGKAASKKWKASIRVDKVPAPSPPLCCSLFCTQPALHGCQMQHGAISCVEWSVLCL